MKTKYTTLLIISALVGLSLGYLGLSLPKLDYSFKGSLIEPAIQAKDFSLFDQHGQTFTLSEQRGKVVLLFFGYTSCPDVCPATLGKYKQIATLLGDQVDQMRFVMVTADPSAIRPRSWLTISVDSTRISLACGVPNKFSGLSIKAIGVILKRRMKTIKPPDIW